MQQNPTRLKQEEKNKKVGLIISGAFHLLLLLAFLFVIAWKEPDPPIPEYGIELNFGTSDVGTGNVQPETDPLDSPEEEEAAPEELPEEVIEEAIEETETIEETPVEETAEQPQTTDNTQASPDVVDKTKKEEKQPVEEVKQEESQQPEVEEKQPEKQPEAGAKGKDGENDTPQNSNQGDNIDKEGDKGDEQGSLDSRALYGQQGGGGGSSLEMTGWVWDFKPQPKDNSNENGRIVFEIKIDDQGEIISVRTLERSVSPAIEKIYRAEVESLTFSKTSDNSLAAPISTGKITFVIKSK